MKQYVLPLTLLISTVVNAELLTPEQLAQQRELAQQIAEQAHGSQRNIVPTGCLASPLPIEPRQPSYYITHSNYDFTETMTLFFLA